MPTYIGNATQCIYGLLLAERRGPRIVRNCLKASDMAVEKDLADLAPPALSLAAPQCSFRVRPRLNIVLSKATFGK